MRISLIHHYYSIIHYPDITGIILWTPPAIQNPAHIPLFGVLAWLWYRSLGTWMKNSRLRFSSAFLLTAGFGILDELHQLYVPGRFASVTDIALKAPGAVLVLRLISRQAYPQRQPPV